MIERARQDLDRRTMALHARGERALHATRAQLHELHHRLAGLHPRARILGHRTAFTELERRLDRAMRELLATSRSELGRLGAQMAAMSPLAVLDRGYAMVRADDRIVRDAAQVSTGDRLDVRLARGSLEVVVDKINDSGAE